MHVYDKNGKQVGTEGVDGGTHDNKTLKDSKIPKRHHEIIRKTARAKVLKQLKAARTGGGLTGRITGHQTRLQRKLPVTGFLPLTVLQGVTGAAADAVETEKSIWEVIGDRIKGIMSYDGYQDHWSIPRGAG
ncbi:hypothetical protein N9B60_04380 [Mariniblastus sp.]|nr:hypothetical protein [Mariniblastus sp.]